MHYRSHCYRHPSRIVWFVLGGAAAAFWIKRKEVCAQDSRWGHCVRVPVQPPPFLQAPREWPTNTCTPSPNPETQTRLSANSQPLAFGNQQAQAQQWEEDKARVLALSKQAGDTMADLSEATLDSIVSTVEVLKAKLAEHRAQRERQQKQLDQELEPCRNNPPPRLV